MTDQTVLIDDLLPCPFRGKKVEIHRTEAGHYAVSCTSIMCPCSYGTYYTEKELKKFWNTRKQPRTEGTDNV